MRPASDSGCESTTRRRAKMTPKSAESTESRCQGCKSSEPAYYVHSDERQQAGRWLCSKCLMDIWMLDTRVEAVRRRQSSTRLPASRARSIA